MCNSSKCSLERCYFFSNSNIVHMSRPVKVYVHYSGGNRLKSCSLMISDYQRLFYSTYYIPNFDDIVDFLKRNAKPNDIVLTQGAGTVTQIGPKLVNN